MQPESNACDLFPRNRQRIIDSINHRGYKAAEKRTPNLPKKALSQPPATDRRGRSEELQLLLAVLSGFRSVVTSVSITSRTEKQETETRLQDPDGAAGLPG